MKIATIVPTDHLRLIKRDDYCMALAHIALKDREYRRWFRKTARSGRHVLLDNGAAELGAGMTSHVVLLAAKQVMAHEIVLPDVISDGDATLHTSQNAYDMFVPKRNPSWRIMAVPQGKSLQEYRATVLEMLKWPHVRALGISRFVVDLDVVPDRLTLLEAIPEIVKSDRDIHLLGCPGDPIEAHHIDQAFPNRIRGIDSGIAAIYTQAGMSLRDGPKPQVELDFAGTLDSRLLVQNIRDWRCRATTGKWWFNT